jgi:hypothetical protein
MIQQMMFDFLGNEIACLLLVFVCLWLMIFTALGIYAIILLCNQDD